MKAGVYKPRYCGIFCKTTQQSGQHVARVGVKVETWKMWKKGPTIRKAKRAQAGEKP